jgi:hypothetical protein
MNNTVNNRYTFYAKRLIVCREAELYKAQSKKEQDETKAKRDLQSLIEKQFALRRKSSCQGNEETSARYSRVRAAESTGLKVNGLAINVCLVLFEIFAHTS